MLPTREFDPSVVGPLTIQLTTDHKFRLKALAVPGGYYNRNLGAYVVENPTPRAAAATIALFPEALIDHPELTAIRDRDYGNARPHDYATDAGFRLDVGDLGPVKLYEWQETDGGYLSAIMERDKGGHVGWDRGLGKTVVSAALIRKLGARRTLVVARNDSKEEVWLKQFKEKPGLLPEADVRVIPDPGKKRDRMLDTIAEEWETGRKQGSAVWQEQDDTPLVFVVHYEAIALIAGPKTVHHKDEPDTIVKGGGDGWARLGHWDLMIFDEGHRLASYNPNSRKNTQMGRALSKLRREYVDIAANLTGSSIMNHAEDLFGQLHFMFPKIYKAKWRDWNNRFIDYVDVGPRKVPIGFRAEMLPALRKELGVFMVYRTKDEVFDLPPLIEQDIELDMYPEQWRIYNEMRDNFWAELEDGGIKAVNPLAQMNLLRRIATYYPGVPSKKLDYTIKELEAYPDEQFVVFTWYKEPGHALAERLGDQAVVVDGDIPGKKRAPLLRLHEAGAKRILIGSIATLGESLNLQYMHEAIRLDRDWNPQVNDQTRDRLYRNGQQSRVTIQDLWAKGTVDMLRVKPTLASKESLRKAVFG